MTNKHICPQCGNPFIPKRKDSKYCSGVCGQAFANEKRRERNSSVLYNRICTVCGKPFTTKRKDSVFCPNPKGIGQSLCGKKVASKKWDLLHGKEYKRKIWNTNPEYRERHREKARKHTRKLRYAALMAYGGLVCSCDHDGQPCGPKPIELLALDHMNGNGKIKNECSTTLFRKLNKLGYPAGFRVLCHNCNLSLGFYGYCPMSKTEKQVRKNRITYTAL